VCGPLAAAEHLFAADHVLGCLFFSPSCGCLGGIGTEGTSGEYSVGHLAFTVTEQDLRELFAPYGVVDRINLLTDRETGRPRGFGFVAMADDKAAQAAIAGLQGTDFAGRTLHVDEAR
jgi:RNA recognition motif. (a.k.a. RRM, RBD, or RNP domain)